MVGRIADKGNIEKIKIVLLLTSFFVLLIPIIEENILKAISNDIESIKSGAILGTLCLFMLPALCMGIFTPIMLKIRIENLEESGKTVGRMNAIATIGGIFGTFLGRIFIDTKHWK